MEVLFLALLFVLMALALGSGFPVAFALPGAAIVTIGIAAGAGILFAGDGSAYFASGEALNWLSAGVTNFRGIYWEAERDTLIAIPLFIFMGIMLQRSKIAEDLLVTMAQLFGPVPGGLGLSVVFVGALLAATTGIVGATVVAMGLISLPAMLRSGYSQPLATGTIAASGTLGQIIPPSIVLIILADQLASAVDQASTARKNEYRDATGELSMPSDFDVVSTSAGDMFLGALLPGLVLVGLYMAYILGFALLRPSRAPAIPYDGARDRAFWTRVLLILIPPLALIFLVLGSIIGGIATVNQAGAIGAIGAMIMAGYRLAEGRKHQFTPAIIAIVAVALLTFVLANFTVNVKNIQTPTDQLGVTLAAIAVFLFLVAVAWSGLRAMRIDDTLRGVMIETAKTTSLVFIILLGAAMLTSAFRAFGGEELVKEFLNSLPGGFWTQFVIVMAVIFLLGFFLDFIEIAVVVVPIVAPILLADPGANVTAVWLGVMIGLNIQTSFLTPPFGFALFYLRGVAPAEVRTLNMYRGVVPFITLQLLALVIVGLNPPLVNYLPNRVSLTAETAPPPRNPRLQICLEELVGEQYATNGSAIEQAIASARSIDISIAPEELREDLEEGFEKAEAAMPLFDEIRTAESAVNAASDAYRPLHSVVRDIRRQMAGVERHREELGRDATEADLAAFDAEMAAIEATIPSDWEERHGEFEKLTQAENKARATYRRNADDAYEPVAEALLVIQSVGDLEPLRGVIEALPAVVEAGDYDVAQNTIQDARRTLGSVEGTDEIRDPLNQARRALRRNPDPEKALEEIAAALVAFDAEIAWRRQAEQSVAPGLMAYREAIKDTIGLRSQDRMPQEIALFVASCSANHRDLSLYF